MRRRLRRPYFAEDKNRQLQEFCLDLVAYIENVSEGNQWTAEDYLAFRGDEDLEITPKDVEAFLDKGIENGTISNIKCEEIDGVKTYTKVGLPFLMVYSRIFNEVYTDLGEDYDSEYTFNQLFGSKGSVERAKQLKKTFDMVVENTDLVEKRVDKGGFEIYKFKSQPKEDYDCSVLPAVFKANEAKIGEEWTLSQFLCEAPTLSQIRSFNCLIEDRIFRNNDNNTDIKCKGFNSSGEMVYARERRE